MMGRKTLSILLTLTLVVPAVAAGQAPSHDGPLTWVSFLTAKPGQANNLTRLLIEQNSAVYGELMKQGKIYNWGIAQPITHTPDQPYSHAEFVVFPDWAAIDTFVGAFMGAQMAKSQEERDAEQAAYREVVVDGSHFDAVSRAAYMGGSPGGPPRYFNLAYFKSRPGQDFLPLYKDYALPVLEKLAADGKVTIFGLDVPELHGDPTWTHMAWAAIPGLASKDAHSAAFAAAAAARTPEENEAFQARFAETLVPDTHFDQVVVVVHYAEAGGGGDDGGDG